MFEGVPSDPCIPVPPMVRTVQMVTCPGCGELMEAVCYDGRAHGWCSAAGKLVTMTVENQALSVYKTGKTVEEPLENRWKTVPLGYAGVTPRGRLVLVLRNKWGSYRAYPETPGTVMSRRDVMRDESGKIINGRSPADLLARLKAEYPDWTWR
jgi:hypothetical protein